MPWDSAQVNMNKYFPEIRGAVIFSIDDSLKLLDQVKKQNGRVVLYNSVGTKAGEVAEWLVKKGFNNTSFLVGGLSLLYEYVLNSGETKPEKYFQYPTAINFTTVPLLCRQLSTDPLVIIDLRQPKVFNTISDGVKHSYSHFQNSINFSSRDGELFEKSFPDKKRSYVFANAFGPEGIDLAVGLAKKGYNITWLIGGYDRWEWFMNNQEGFSCNNLVEK